MSGFNFGQIGNVMSKYFDTDYMDIKRDVLGQLQTVYVNVPCNISFKTADNPDPVTVAVKPINTSLVVHMSRDIDIRNDDYLILKKVGENNRILHTYGGRCGEPVMYQSRQKVTVAMKSDLSEEPTPIPPSNPVIVRISYTDIAGTVIQAGTEHYLTADETQTFYPPVILGYEAIETYVNGILQDTPYAVIDSTSSAYEIKFVYKTEESVSYLRLLLKGLYTKDDGSLASGYYLYKKIPLDLISSDSTSYRFSVTDIRFIHEDTGEPVIISTGTKMVLYPSQVYVAVTDVQEMVDSYIVTANVFTPTEDEKNAYMTEYYE